MTVIFFYVKHKKICYFLEYVNQRNSAYIVLDQIEYNVAKILSTDMQNHQE